MYGRTRSSSTRTGWTEDCKVCLGPFATSLRLEAEVRNSLRSASGNRRIRCVGERFETLAGGGQGVADPIADAASPAASRRLATVARCTSRIRCRACAPCSGAGAWCIAAGTVDSVPTVPSTVDTASTTARRPPPTR